MDSYFLIARSRKDNSFTVLKLREDWYLGQDKGRKDVLTRCNDLEAIDLVTSRFSSESEMAERMSMNGYIPDSNVDIFIAGKKEKEGKTFIKFEEVIYNQGKARRICALRRIALTSLATDFKDDSYDLATIYDEVIALAYMADDYLQMLLDGDTNVSRKFAEQLRGIGKYLEIPYGLKSKPGFGAKDYATVRNIVESINRLEGLDCSSMDDRFIKNAEFVESNLSCRMSIVPELADRLGKNYVEGQLSCFSLLDDNGMEKVQEATQAVVEEEKMVSAKIYVPRSGVTDADKRKEIYRVLRSVPHNTFYKEKDSETLKVNYSLFEHYPPSDNEKGKLDTYLTGNLPKYLSRYIRNYRLLCDAQQDGFSSSSELCELQTEVEYDIRRIDNRFKSRKTLNMVYEWCMLLEGAYKRDKAIGEGAKVSSDIDDRAKTYGKK